MLSAACATVATRPGAMRAAARTPKQSIAARATPAVVMAREAPGAAMATASGTGRRLASSQMRPTTNTL